MRPDSIGVLFFFVFFTLYVVDVPPDSVSHSFCIFLAYCLRVSFCVSTSLFLHLFNFLDFHAWGFLQKFSMFELSRCLSVLLLLFLVVIFLSKNFTPTAVILVFSLLFLIILYFPFSLFFFFPQKMTQISEPSLK